MRTIVLLAATAALAWPGVGAADSTVAKTSVVASADIRHRTSIVPSTGILHFHVSDERNAAEATITFATGARVAADSRVQLVVKTDGPLESGGVALTLGDGIGSRAVVAGEPIVAAEWVGGGLKAGRLQFHLRAAPGRYAIPVALQVIVP